MLSELELDQLIQGFQNHTLPKEQWTHQAHLILGLFYTTSNDLETSIELMREGVKNYNVAVGGENTDTAGYHESITVFFMYALRAFHDQFKSDTPFVKLVKLFEESRLVDQEFMLQFYSKHLLFSVQARREWVEPDLQPLSALSQINFINPKSIKS